MKLVYKLCPGYVHLDYLIEGKTYVCKPVQIGKYGEVLYYIHRGEMLWDRTGCLSHTDSPDYYAWGKSGIKHMHLFLNNKKRIFELVY